MDEDPIMLEEARRILADKRALLKIYPDKFSLRLSILQWGIKVAKLENTDDTPKESD